MLDLRQYDSLGEALRAALDRWPNEICLIEADRDRENCPADVSRNSKEGSAAACARRFRMPASDGSARRHHHEQSVEMADFRLCAFFAAACWFRSITS